MKIKIINGANLNMLGRREPLYGSFTYEEMKKMLTDYAAGFNHGLDVGPDGTLNDWIGGGINCGISAELDFFISNHEGEIIEAVQNCDADAMIINAGAYSHTSLAIADALRIQHIPKIEVHLSNIHKRDRHVSVTGAACDGVISGLGIEGYKLAISLLAGITAQKLPPVR